MEAGLEPGDVVVAVDGWLIDGRDDFGVRVRAVWPGTALVVDVLRNGEVPKSSLVTLPSSVPLW